MERAIHPSRHGKTGRTRRGYHAPRQATAPAREWQLPAWRHGRDRGVDRRGVANASRVTALFQPSMISNPLRSAGIRGGRLIVQCLLLPRKAGQESIHSERPRCDDDPRAAHAPRAERDDPSPGPVAQVPSPPGRQRMRCPSWVASGIIIGQRHPGPPFLGRVRVKGTFGQPGHRRSGYSNPRRNVPGPQGGRRVSRGGSFLSAGLSAGGLGW